jgi:hypothetical protein
MNGILERCETCGQIVDTSEIRYDEVTNTTSCTNDE